jgi:hypothetical protein
LKNVGVVCFYLFVGRTTLSLIVVLPLGGLFLREMCAFMCVHAARRLGKIDFTPQDHEPNQKEKKRSAAQFSWLLLL